MEEKTLEIRIPFVTIVKVLVTLVVVHTATLLSPLIMIIFLAALISISLSPVVQWAEKKGLKRWVAVAAIAFVMTALIVAFVSIIAPRLAEEISGFVTKLPEFRQTILSKFPAESPFHQPVERLLKVHALENPMEWLEHLFSVGQLAFGGISQILIILIISIYLLADGIKAYLWFAAFFSPKIKKKLEQTAEEISQVVFAYVAGQVITSILSTIYVFIILSLLHVPAAVFLAMVAGIFDVLPILGFFLAVVPAILLALKVSSSTAIIVFFLYLFYHGVENYFIVPAVYGNRLRVSTLVVLVALLGGGLLAGIPGAVAILPIIASYPIIERVWLKEYLGHEVVKDHKEVQNNSPDKIKS